MRKLIGILIVLCCLSGSVGTVAQTIELHFIQMPLELLPNLPLNSRKDLVDFLKNDRAAVMPAAFNGQMALKQLSSDYLLLETSSVSTLQLKLLPMNDSNNVLVVVNSARGPLPNSQVRFYTTDWKPIDRLRVPEMDALDFLDVSGAGTELSERFNQICPRLFVHWIMATETFEIHAIASIKEDVPLELLEPYMPWVKDTVLLKWQDGTFVKQR